MRHSNDRVRDGLTMAALVALTIGLAVQYTRGRLMWSDELLGWMVVTDPSWRHALWAWTVGADGGGLWFYVLARLWVGVFGQSAAAFRMFSAAGVAAGVVLTFAMLRRYFRWSVAAVAVLVVWFSSDVVLWQVMQARFYGLLLAATALCCAVAVWSERRGEGWKVWVMVFGAHLLLVGTHPFGVVYSAVVVLAMVAADWMNGRRWRPRVYLAPMARWVVLLPSIPALRSSAAVARPHFWTVAPTMEELGNAYSCWSLLCQVVLAGVAVAFLGVLGLRWLRWSEVRREARAHSGVLLLSAGLLGVPLVVFVKSLWGESLFVDRYLLPVVIGMSGVLCQLMTWVADAMERRARWTRGVLRVAGAGAVVAAMYVAMVRFPAVWRYPGVGEDAALLRALPKGVPVVVEAVDRFDQMEVYHGAEGYQLVSVLEWAGATSPDSLRGEVTAFHEMENWRRVGYYAGSIRDSAEFLRSAKEFVVVDEPRLRWMERRVLGQPEFRVTPMAADGVSGGVRLWLVQRTTPGAATTR